METEWLDLEAIQNMTPAMRERLIAERATVERVGYYDFAKAWVVKIGERYYAVSPWGVGSAGGISEKDEPMPNVRGSDLDVGW